MNSVCLFGKFYGTIKSNQRRGDPPAGEGLWVQFSVGVYNFYKKGIEFFPCVAFGKTAERVLKLYADKGYVGVTGSLRHDKREYQGKKYNDYKVHVFGVYTPVTGGEEQSGPSPTAAQEPAPGGVYGGGPDDEPPF